MLIVNNLINDLTYKKKGLNPRDLSLYFFRTIHLFSEKKSSVQILI